MRLVDEAKARFQPSAVTAQVRGRHGDLYIVDAGLQKGLRPGDQIGADARVAFADIHYALVAPALDTLSVGQTLSRYVAQPVESRPSALPDYFLRVTVAPLEPVQAPTNVCGVERRVQDARVFLEVIDHDGRVVFAVEGKDQQVDEIAGGMAPSTAQRRDAAVRNAMLQAAQALKAGFTPARVKLRSLQPMTARSSSMIPPARLA